MTGAQPVSPHIKKHKAADKSKSQRQKFIDKACELGADGDEDAFRRALKAVATAPVPSKKKPKK